MPRAATEEQPHTEQSEAEKSVDFVTALARGLEVITCFDAGFRRMTLSEVATRTGLSRGTARRFLLTLEKLGYAATDGKLFWLTPKVLRLGNAYLASFDLGDAVRGILRRVAERVGDSCSMAVFENGYAAYVARAEAPRPFATALSLNVGSYLPAYCSSLGRVLLAGLSDAEIDSWLSRQSLEQVTEKTITDPARLRAAILDVRRQGYAIVNGEMELGLRSLGVPVVDRHGRVIAALNTATLTARTSLDQLRRVSLPALREAAVELAQIMEAH